MMAMMKNIKRINIEVFVNNIFNVENGCFQEEVNEIVNVYGRMLKKQVRAVECSDEAMISNTLNIIFKEMVMDAKICGFYHILLFIVFCTFFDEHHKEYCRGYAKEKLVKIIVCILCDIEFNIPSSSQSSFNACMIL